MKRILFALTSISFLVSDSQAQAEFRFHVSNLVRSDKVGYERIQQVEVGSNDDGTAWVSFHEYFHVYAINQAEFTYQPVRYHSKLPKETYQEFLNAVAKLDPKQLEKETVGSGLFVWGTLNIGDKEYRVRADPDSAERKAWEDLFIDLRKRYPPAPDDKQDAIVLQGDTVAPVEVSFAELLKTPKKYAGKRVKVVGYYHGEFEGSSFSQSKESNSEYERAFWLDGVDTTKINDAFIVVEATFEPHNHGHMGLWKGALSRATVRIATNKEVEQANAGQPATRSQSKSKGGDKPQTHAEGRSR